MEGPVEPCMNMEGPVEPCMSENREVVECLEDKYDEIKTKRIRLPRQAVESVQNRKQCAKEKRAALKRKVSQILQKLETERTCEEAKILKSSSKIVKEIHQKRIKREEAKRRLEEFEDSEDVLDQKCQILAQAIAQSQHLVVYTGAGISTAAKIPDYRGPDGIWTRLKEGRDIGDHDLSLAEPTYTHMALYELYRQRILKYVVSQNCDGLHLRSGLPKTALSEVHGNMYIEVCKDCKPHREYWRLFDVTESTARYSHKTYRRCYICNGPLMDTIVHFGERGSLQWPLNWKGACKNAKEATTILCIGSSLKVLKKYPWLWQMDKPMKKRPNLYIINLQWTPKDEFANVKVNGKCDVVFKKIMDILGIMVPKYDKTKDPIFYHATELNELENHTTTRFSLSVDDDVQNSKHFKFEKKCKEEFNDDFNNVPQIKEDGSNYDNDCIDEARGGENSSSQSSQDETMSETNSNKDCTFSDKTDLDYLNCDTNSSNNSSSPEEQNLLPQPRSFLNGARPRLLDPTLSLLSYNLLHSQVFGAYTNFLLYPYQTSFLYPGLHSIINPMPAIKEEPVPKQEQSFDPQCEFCHENYRSLVCVFYEKVEPVFKKEVVRFSKIENKEKPNVCECCDYTTEEEDAAEDNSASEKDRQTDIGASEQKGKVQPGWFGKGYRKGRRFKRKLL